MTDIAEPRWSKGPWAAKYLPQHRYRVTADEGDISICDVALWTVDYEENEANAHLIAAAPELYDALEKVERSLIAAIRAGMIDADFTEKERFEIVNEHPAIKLARTARARARGETQ